MTPERRVRNEENGEKRGKRGCFPQDPSGRSPRRGSRGSDPTESPESADSIPTEENLRNFSLFPSILASRQETVPFPPVFGNLRFGLEGIWALFTRPQQIPSQDRKIWASAHPRFSFPAGFRQFRLRLRKKLGSFHLLPEISASQPGNSIPFPPGFWKFLPQCEIFFPFSSHFQPLEGPFQDLKICSFPCLFSIKKKKKIPPFLPVPSILGFATQKFGGFWSIFEQPFPIPNNSIPLFQQRRWN